MAEFADFGKVWMASSPFTESFGPIKAAMKCGIDAVVLKSCSPNVDVEKRKFQTRLLQKYAVIHPDGSFFPSIASDETTGELRLSKTLSCTSTGCEIELLTIEEANRLYDAIKSYSPIKVILSFAPRFSDDFSHISELKADAIEINPRFYNSPIPRPYLLRVEGKLDADENPALKEKEEQAEQYAEFRFRKTLEIKRGLESIALGIPVLFKMCREQCEMDFFEQINFHVNGFTYSDSSKSGTFRIEDGCAVKRWGRGSICGESLTLGTRAGVKSLRGRIPDKYISASGGVMNEEDALACLEFANSVQICSAVYFDGFQKLRKIIDAVKSPALT